MGCNTPRQALRPPDSEQTRLEGDAVDHADEVADVA
jgi:hypothetical protein